VFYEPHRRDTSLLPHDPFKALVAPRPIGWVSTVGAGGAVNLAPYSYFNAVSSRPPMLIFSSEGLKDSAAFAARTREFVWNVATWDLREQMNATSAALPRGVSEFDHAGLRMAPSRMVAPPRVAESPCALECRVTQTFSLDDVARAWERQAADPRRGRSERRQNGSTKATARSSKHTMKHCSCLRLPRMVAKKRSSLDFISSIGKKSRGELE